MNTYAMNFVVMIPSNISDLQFSWQSLTKNPVSFMFFIYFFTTALLMAFLVIIRKLDLAFESLNTSVIVSLMAHLKL